MEIEKIETSLVINTLEKFYSLLSNDHISVSQFFDTLPKVANFCINIHPMYNNNSDFLILFNHVYQLMSNLHQKDTINYLNQDNILKFKRYELLSFLEQFEVSIIKELQFNLFLNIHNVEMRSIKMEHVKSVTDLKNADFSFKKNKRDALVYIYSGEVQQQEEGNFDFYIAKESILESKNSLISKLNQFDYYKRDRFYLEAKLDSLKKRQDIRLLLAGSSYTMCGLFEKQMPLPARNVAVDAQDLYYSIKSIRTALDYNPNITHCILSFAYYFWGYDLSLSTSLYQYKRVTEVNYPVFKDKHNFSGVLEDRTQTFLTSITPLRKHLFLFDKLAEQQIKKIKESFVDAHYFPYPRVGSAVLKNDEQTNHQLAQKRAASHNKFFKYQSTVEENKKLFADFLEEMNSKGVQIILFVPPVTEYYRNYINPDLISNFYECMEPLKSKFQFTLIDLFNSDQFESGDFYDYDHLNDRGAKKLGKILGKELDI
ncbi:hypothetical protein NST17_16455 [Caldifermentibacillus hisashii]|uniref:DUF1574 domain-containing protein n=1 Tax=Caldifermentibacillus hisashii TaxID=996558 RepID=A0ABU9K0V2_9BACI